MEPSEEINLAEFSFDEWADIVLALKDMSEQELAKTWARFQEAKAKKGLQ